MNVVVFLILSEKYARYYYDLFFFFIVLALIGFFSFFSIFIFLLLMLDMCCTIYEIKKQRVKIPQTRSTPNHPHPSLSSVNLNDSHHVVSQGLIVHLHDRS